MAKFLNRFLSLMLCAAMLLGMVPGMTAFAAEKETEATQASTEAAEATEAPSEETTSVTEETTPQEPTEETIPEETAATIPAETEETIPAETEGEIVSPLSENEGIALTAADIGDTFTTFEELKVLAGESYSEYTTVTYAGSDALTVTEDLSIPQKLGVFVEDNDIIVASGVTVSIGVSSSMNCRAFTIDGTVNLSGYLFTTGGLTVNGKLNIGSYGGVSLSYPATITGKENISFTGSGGYLFWNFTADSREELDRYAEEIRLDSDTHSSYSISIQSDISLDNFTIPQRTNVWLDNGCTADVSQGATLTVNGTFGIYGTLKVDGEVVITPGAYLRVDNGVYSYGTNEGRLEVSESGVLNIQGYFMVDTSADTQLEDLKSFLIGLDFSKYQISLDGAYEESKTWSVQKIEGLTQLGTPTDLKWGYLSPYEERPGYMFWRDTEPFQGQVRVAIYREGNATPVYTMNIWGSLEYMPEYQSFEGFITKDLDSGTYYFTVTAIGDGTAYYNSETAVSETWEYVRPDEQVGSCGNLFWNGATANWTLPEDAGGCELEYYFAGSENETPVITGSVTGYYSSFTSDNINDFNFVAANGNGYYYFRVRAISPDITKYRNGEWSEMSPAYNLNAISESVNASLDDILNNQTEAEDIKSAVQGMDTQDLKSAMQADQSGTGTVAKLEELEKKVGTTVVEVTDEASDFDSSKVSIVGASLNQTVNSSENVKLIVDKPDVEHILPTQYDNSVSIQFSMDLDNVTDTENLAVPVKITLPVPGDINPSFLVILHYHMDGTREEIRPYVYQGSDGYYASFVLTSFSDFVMTQRNTNPVEPEDTSVRSVTLDRDYITMEAGDAPVRLTAAVIPEEWAADVTWSVENLEGESVISVSEFGDVTPLNPGAAYAVATVNHGEYVFSARCRVDVTEKETKTEVLGVQLSTNALTTEVYSANYATFDALLLLEQNLSDISTFSTFSAERSVPEDNGVAIASARFQDSETAKYFDLVVKDDRTLQVIPTQAATAVPSPVKGSYVSKVVVNVAGEDFVSDTSVKLTVKKTSPKLKAASLTFNPFFSNQSQKIVISGATVAGMEVDTAKATAKTPAIPEWLTLEDGTLTLKNAPKSGSGKVNLLVYTEEWVIPAQVAVSVKLSYKAPGLKLSASTVTVPSYTDPEDGSESISAAYIQLLCKNKKETLEGLGVSKIEAPDGSDVWVDEGTFPASDNHFYVWSDSGKIILKVHFHGTDSTVDLPLTIKTKHTPIKVQAYTEPNIKLTSAALDGFYLWWWSYFDFDDSDLRWVFRDKKGNILPDTAFTVEESPEDHFLNVKTTAQTQPGSYEMVLDLYEGETRRSEESTVVKFTVLGKNVKPGMTVKASNAIDLTYPDAYARLDFTHKNVGSSRYEWYEPVVLDAKGNNVTDMFRFGNGSEGYQVSLEPGQSVPAGTYTIKWTIFLGTEFDYRVETTTKLTVKRTAVRLSGKGTIDPIRDSSSVLVTPNCKYCLAESELGSKAKVQSSKDGKNFNTDVTNSFQITANQDGTFTVTKKAGVKLDSALKYRLKLSYSGADAYLTLNVKSASAKVTAASAALYRNDRFSRFDLRFTVTDKTLNTIEKIQIKNAKMAELYEIYDYGNGQFAIGFKGSKVPAGVKSGTVPLEIFFEGNTSGKPNATLNLKVQVL